jgi:outer membrane cobalamin receptor
MGGVINIITKKKNVPVSFSATYGSYGELAGNVSTSGDLDQVHYLASYNNLKSDGFRVNSDYATQGYNLNLSIADAMELYANTTN